MTLHGNGDFQQLFAQQAQREDSEIELDLAALYLAGEEYPDLDLVHYLNLLDRIATEVDEAAVKIGGDSSLVDSLNRYFFDLQGYSGNTADYSNPDNSHLNRVLDTRKGIPITLSVIYLEVCRRLGISAHGVGLPGHFIIALEELDLFLDPYNGGQLLSAADCRRLVQDLFGTHFPWREEFLAVYTKQEILFRMLSNLKAIYARDRDYRRGASVLEKMALINSSPWIYRELAWCYHQIGENQQAIKCIEQYLATEDTGEDATEARQQMLSLWNSISQAT